MEIRNVIVHSIVKDQHQTDDEIQLHLRQDEFPLTDKIKDLLVAINKVYTYKTGKAFGSLNQLAAFSISLRHHVVEQTTPFIQFSQSSVTDLRSRIAAQPLSTGGYIVFTRFTSVNNKDFFMVVMLKSKEGLSFDDALELMDAHHLDLDKLHFAARIDLNAWINNDEGSNVSFVKGRATSNVTRYFRDFLGIQEFSESIAATKKLVIAVTNYYRQHLGKTDDEVENYKKIVHDYCKNKDENNEAIYLDELSRTLDEENPENFMVYAQENHEIPNEFSIDRNTLRKFIKYSGQDRDLSISFAASVLGTRVMFDQAADTLTIRQVPSALKAQLLQANNIQVQTDATENQQ